METMFSSGGSNYLKDLSGNGLNCTSNSLNTSTGGLKGKALKLSTNSTPLVKVACRRDDYSIATKDVLYYKKPFSLFFTYRLDTTNDGGILNMGANQPYTLTYYLTGGVRRLGVSLGEGAFHVIENNSSINTNEFNITNINFDGRYLSLFENGNFIGTHDYNLGGSGTIYDLIIGSSYFLGGSMTLGNTTFDDVKLYNKSFSQSEIMEIYKKMR